MEGVVFWGDEGWELHQHVEMLMFLLMGCAGASPDSTKQRHRHTGTQPHSHPHSHTAIQQHSQTPNTATQPHRHPATQPHSNTDPRWAPDGFQKCIVLNPPSLSISTRDCKIIPRICQDSSQNTPRISPGYSQDLPSILSEYH